MKQPKQGQQEPFRFDRTAFKMQTVEKADDQLEYWLSKTPTERIQAAWYLISQAYNFDIRVLQKLDRTKFSVRQFNS